MLILMSVAYRSVLLLQNLKLRYAVMNDCQLPPGARLIGHGTKLYKTANTVVKMSYLHWLMMMEHRNVCFLCPLLRRWSSSASRRRGNPTLRRLLGEGKDPLRLHSHYELRDSPGMVNIIVVMKLPSNAFLVFIYFFEGRLKS